MYTQEEIGEQVSKRIEKGELWVDTDSANGHTFWGKRRKIL